MLLLLLLLFSFHLLPAGHSVENGAELLSSINQENPARAPRPPLHASSASNAMRSTHLSSSLRSSLGSARSPTDGDEVPGENISESHFSAEDELTLCRTGEEVVEFFCHSWPGDPVKFVHLNMTDSGLLYRPYDLVGAEEKCARSGFLMCATSV